MSIECKMYIIKIFCPTEPYNVCGILVKQQHFCRQTRPWIWKSFGMRSFATSPKTMLPSKKTMSFVTTFALTTAFLLLHFYLLLFFNSSKCFQLWHDMYPEIEFEYPLHANQPSGWKCFEWKCYRGKRISLEI